MTAHLNNVHLNAVEMESVKQRSEFVNALLDSKEKLVELKDAQKAVLVMDSVMEDYVYAMMVSLEKIVHRKLV